MIKNPKILLQHILESIEWVEDYIYELPEEEFMESVQTQDAVLRRLEIIGEAVRNLSEDFKKLHAAVPWQKIAGMRNILIHEYFDVDLNLVWNTVKKDLPELKKHIEGFLKN